MLLYHVNTKFKVFNNEFLILWLRKLYFQNLYFNVRVNFQATTQQVYNQKTFILFKKEQ